MTSFSSGPNRITFDDSGHPTKESLQRVFKSQGKKWLYERICGIDPFLPLQSSEEDATDLFRDLVDCGTLDRLDVISECIDLVLEHQSTVTENWNVIDCLLGLLEKLCRGGLWLARDYDSHHKHLRLFMRMVMELPYPLGDALPEAELSLGCVRLVSRFRVNSEPKYWERVVKRCATEVSRREGKLMSVDVRFSGCAILGVSHISLESLTKLTQQVDREIVQSPTPQVMKVVRGFDPYLFEAFNRVVQSMEDSRYVQAWFSKVPVGKDLGGVLDGVFARLSIPHSVRTQESWGRGLQSKKRSNLSAGAKVLRNEVKRHAKGLRSVIESESISESTIEKIASIINEIDRKLPPPRFASSTEPVLFVTDLIEQGRVFLDLRGKKAPERTDENIGKLRILMCSKVFWLNILHVETTKDGFTLNVREIVKNCKEMWKNQYLRSRLNNGLRGFDKAFIERIETDLSSMSPTPSI